MNAAAFPPIEDLEGDDDRDGGPRLIREAAPGRTRLRVLMIGFLVLFAGLGARAVQLSLAGGAHTKTAQAAAHLAHRADLMDRNGVLLATTVPAFTLVAVPHDVWDAPAVAHTLAAHLPGLDEADTLARLKQSKSVVYLKRDLTAHQRDEIFKLGLPGVDFEDQDRRVYPQGLMAAHALGGANARMQGDGGVELGLDKLIQRSGDANEPLRLALDVRIQHALEIELAGTVGTTGSQGGAGIILDGRTGEVLAIASAPSYDPNSPPADPKSKARLDRAAGALYEMGSTLKPFTVAMALDAGQTKPDEVFNLAHPLELQGFEIKDLEQMGAATPLPKALAASSNIMAATLAMRVGAQRQMETFTKLGFNAGAGLELPQSERPVLPHDQSPLSVAVMGYGHGMAMTLASLAGAYTVFTNDGARTTPTLLAHAQGDAVRKVQVFTPQSTRQVLAMMRQVVTTGTGKRANLAGLDMAGKTGSADKPEKGGYSSDRMLSSFAAIFPAHDPHYVMVVALDEPKRVGKGAVTGGAVAAPLAAHIAARIAPLLNVSDDGLSDAGDTSDEGEDQ